MKRNVRLPATWLVGRKTRLRALEADDVPLLRRSKLAFDPKARGFVVQTLDGRDIGALAVLVSGPHAAVTIGFADAGRYADGSAADALAVIRTGLPRALPVMRIEALVSVADVRVVAAYERAGFEREGILREALLDGKTFRDAAMMSALVDG